eukprot:m.78327 g.78327  ORF g.78327 m.78327 type:complete len:634 (+) comp50563_c0_seq2:92-1993(+)
MFLVLQAFKAAMSMISGILRQVLLAVVFIISVLVYVCISKLKDFSYKFRPWYWKRNEMYKRMTSATTYREFQTAAVDMDSFSGKALWKKEPESTEYHADMIAKRLSALRTAFEAQDWDALLVLLRENLVRNIGGLGNPFLYNYCHIGTKDLIEDYMAMMEKCLEYVAEQDVGGMDLRAKERFFANSRQAYGRSALLFSGGFSLGMSHFGVAKCLLEQGLLPTVICGASIGALVACIIGAHSDEELRELLENPNAFKFSAFEGLRQGSAVRKIKRLLKHGILMDVNILQQFCKENLDEMTLHEAYRKTGRIINIVLTNPPPGVPHVLNHLTAPNVLLWSAACASCVQPGLYEAVDLFGKDMQGGCVPINVRARAVVRSQVHDLPFERIAQLFNVDHFIVSQTNPHMVAAVRATKSSSRFSLLHRFVMAVGREMHHRTLQFFTLLPLPSQLKWFRFDFIKSPMGDITVVPHLSISTILDALSNPNGRTLRASIKVGERSAFPQIAMIRNRCRVEQALHRCTRAIRARLVASNLADAPLRFPTATSIVEATEDESVERRLSSTDEEMPVFSYNTYGVDMSELDPAADASRPYRRASPFTSSPNRHASARAPASPPLLARTPAPAPSLNPASPAKQE